MEMHLGIRGGQQRMKKKPVNRKYGMILKHRATLARRHLRQEETPPETYKENLDLRSVQFIDVTLKDFGVMKSLKKE